MVAILKDKKGVRKSKVYTFEEYLRREEKALEKHEFYQGKIVKRHSVSAIESEMSVNISTSIKYALKPIDNEFHVHNSGLKIFVESTNIGVYPTIQVIEGQAKQWLNFEGTVTNPTLIVEILPHGFQANKALRKFDLYKELPSFQEYVLINTDTYSVETRFREEPDLWRIKTETNIDNAVNLRSLGVSILMTDIYENIVFPLKN